MGFRDTFGFSAVLLVAFSGCGGPSCEETGVNKGNRFAFTVLGEPTQNGLSCSASHPMLTIGEQFEMVAGGFHEPSDAHRCGEHAAVPPAMGDWGPATLCREWDRQLGLTCRWADCQFGFVELHVAPTIEPGQDIVSDGEVFILWSRSTCDSEEERGDCLERYPVRIERL